MIFLSKVPRSTGGDSFQPVSRPQLQRKCACGGTIGLSGECASCERKRRTAPPIQTKLAVNAPGDRHEREADRMADFIVSGKGRTPPSLSPVSASGMQREETKPAPPKPNNYDEAVKKILDALKETAVAKELKTKAAEMGEDFVASVEGKVIVSSALGGTLAAIIATNSELPMQIPELPLNFIAPGLKAKITWEGPARNPTNAGLVLTTGSGVKFGASYSNTSASPGKPAEQKGGLSLTIPLGGSSEKKKGPSESEKFRAETARLAAEQAKIRESQKTPAERANDKAFLNDYVRSKLNDPLNPLALPGLGRPLVPEPERKWEEEPLQRKASSESASAGNAPPIVDEVLHSSGQPLDSGTRGFMEERFGHDFGNVRVHQSDRAEASARAVNAHAYTVGRDIVFGAGRFAPETQEGRRLLAHELTHTIQQSDFAQTGVSQGLSEEADRRADRNFARTPIGPISKGPPALARKKGPVGSSGKLRAISNWSYVVYGDEIRLRYYDKGPPGKPEIQIGTIPWVTNNPGNLTISPNITPAPTKFPIPAICKSTKKEEEVSPDSLQALPINLGAVGLYACRYAIFPSLEAGMNAIVPHLRGIAEKSGNPNMTVEQALRHFKGLEKSEKAEMERQREAGLPVVDVRDSYVATIKAHMTKMMTANEALEVGESPEGLSADELKAIMKNIKGRIKALMEKKILEVTAADTDMRHIVRGLVQKEGFAAPPGVIFKCAGFETGPASLYDGQQKALTTALTSSQAVRDELGPILECK